MRTRTNKRTVLGITIVVFLLMVVLLVQSRRLSASIASGTRQLNSLKQEMKDEKNRTDEIAEQEKYMQSDEYKEKVAKEKLGLIKDGETIFKEAE